MFKHFLLLIKYIYKRRKPENRNTKLESILKNSYVALRVRNKQKIFCIGFNKTGTVSTGFALLELGFILAPQRPAEKMFFDWVKRDFKNLIKFCKYAGQAFKDIPFSLPYTYIVLDQNFPNSKFILTIRDNAEKWYKSITTFHAKLWGRNERKATKEDLKNATYIYKGYPWYSMKKIYNIPDDDPYKKEILINHYLNHNRNIKDYFRNRPKDLLVLNVAKEGAYQELAKFLNVNTNKTIFPWKKKTSDIKSRFKKSIK